MSPQAPHPLNHNPETMVIDSNDDESIHGVPIPTERPPLPARSPGPRRDEAGEQGPFGVNFERPIPHIVERAPKDSKQVTKSRDELHAQVKEREERLAEEIKRLRNELQAERQKLKNAEESSRMQQKKYKQALIENNKLVSQSQAFPLMTDSYLISQVEHLRQEIRNFAIQHYDGDTFNGPNKGNLDPAFWRHYMEPTTRTYAPEDYLEVSEMRPMVIEAFLWRVIVGEVFNNYWWAIRIQRALSRVMNFVKKRSSSKPEDIRKVQMWAASTTELVIEAHNLSQETRGFDEHPDLKKDKLAEDICDILEPYCCSHDSSLSRQLRHVLDNAIALDRDISRQVAQVKWEFPPKDDMVSFDPDTMKLREGEKISASSVNREVQIVICPCLRKRGKSDGKDFQTEILLMKAKVSCEAVPDREPSPNQGSGTHYSHSFLDAFVFRRLENFIRPSQV
ncbi:hypothetical protein BDV30DRAFT_211266 [Aspergillus minisclerotigenes]|uniref:Uncharacterized protein n=1 Tax=Aspergillus minisclerotigenes TaxID=656917 RepID=A0A5N6J226_9EURO|nr:hypothetical protein BDV30DRAFT_211266 [Aspergillus minisclerotigenes]